MISKNGSGNDTPTEMIYQGRLYRKRHVWRVLCQALYQILAAIFFFWLFSTNVLPFIPIGFIVLVMGGWLVIAGCVSIGAAWREAVRQKQYFSETGVLCVHIAKSSNLPMVYWINTPDYDSLFQEYMVRHISSITTTYATIVIRGTIDCAKHDNSALFKRNRIKNETLQVLRIPRNFTNEDLIIHLDIKKYNESMRQAVISKTAAKRDEETQQLAKKEEAKQRRRAKHEAAKAEKSSTKKDGDKGDSI